MSGSKLLRAALLVLSLVLASSRTQGVTARPTQDGQESEKTNEEAGARKPAVQDPTRPSEALREAFDQASGVAPAVVTQVAVPPMHLRGSVLVPGRPAAAVVEVEGRYLRVKEGEEFSLPGHPGLGRFRVTEIDEMGLRLRFDGLGRELVLP